VKKRASSVVRFSRYKSSPHASPALVNWHSFSAAMEGKLENGLYSDGRSKDIAASTPPGIEP